ncbi:MAG: M56 family metallopeptidase [Bacteroidetes bacterium]|jgi:beta-lactamase regulating signal transducer with metallopeptidase domain|nr:M56 family metallopeptidase [Bacteroidota bacterium]
MKTFWAPFISDHTIQAICWTLIHSLWIGLVIALLAGLVITITRKSDAAFRYNLLCGILILFTASVCVTFCIEIWTPAVEQGAFHATQTIHAPGGLNIIVPATTPHISLVSRIVMVLNEYSNIIFMIWLLLFVLKSMKMAGGLLYIQRIRNYRVHEVSEDFKHKIELFAGQIGIREAVRLVQSELVKVPVAVGWLKPMILLPMGILLQLSPEQLESILWHELAHIRRRDYLVNILQGIIETAFFFNPGLLWLSSLIRAEREACCDDIVLSRTNRKANYLEALLSFGYEDNSRTKLAMSIGGGNQLRDRLKRMVNQENKRLSIAEKMVLGVGLILLSAFTSLPKTTNNAVQHLMHVIVKKHVAADSLKLTLTEPKVKLQPVIRHQFGEDTIVKKQDTSIHFTSILFSGNDNGMENSDIKAKDDHGNQYHFTVTDSKLTSLEVNERKVKDSELPSYQYIVNNIKERLAEKRRIRDIDIERFKANSPNAKLKLKNLPDKQKWIKDDLESKFMKDATMKEMAHRDSIRYDNDRQRVNNVIAELVKAGVAPDAASVKWFGLTDAELIVNGKKQPDELHGRLKAAYEVHKDYGLYYGPVDMVGKGVFMDATTPEARLQFRNLNQLRLKQKQLMLQDKKLMLQDTGFHAKQLKLWSGKKQNMQQLWLKDDRWAQRDINIQAAIDGIVADLVSANVVGDKGDLVKFNLTNSELTVNGIKQSDELHEKLKAKYLRRSNYQLSPGFIADPDFGLHFDAKTGSTGLGINIDKKGP